MYFATSKEKSVINYKLMRLEKQEAKGINLKCVYQGS